MKLLKKRYEDLCGIDGISVEDLATIEEKLQVKLPLDFCEIAAFYSGGCLGKEIYSFLISDPQNIVNETLILRKSIELPHNFIVLTELAESIIVMDIEQKPSILWIDSVEADMLKTRDFISKPDVWDTFSDFFSFLLDDEEEERKY